MSAVIEKSVVADSISSYELKIQERQARVTEIVRKHSMRTFGHPLATKKEIRNEVIRHSLELAFLNS